LGKTENDITTKNKFFFQQIGSWKPFREIVELADGQGITYKDKATQRSLCLY